MPALPEVETTRRGLRPYALKQRIVALEVHEPRLRWRVASDLPRKVAGERILDIGRRAKYLLLQLESGTLLLHLGMSGNLRVVPARTPRLPGVDGRKASKSLGNAIPLTASPAVNPAAWLKLPVTR